MHNQYERIEDDGSVKRCPMNDYDASITGHIIYNVPAWFDENPGEAQRLGWIRHITYDNKEVKERWPHNAQTQLLVKTVRVIDEWTVEDEYHVMDKPEELLEREEISAIQSYAAISFVGGDFDEF